MPKLKKVLYVGDDADIRAMVRVGLETMGGFTVYICSSGQDALDTVPAFEPDLILLDVHMPQMDGPATLQRLRQIPATTQVPIIFLAENTSGDADTLSALGAVAVISKPIDPMALSDQLITVWQQLSK